MTGLEPAAGQLDVYDVLELVAGEQRAPARAGVRGELVAPAAELVDRVRGDAGGEPADPAHLHARVPALRGVAGPAGRARRI